MILDLILAADPPVPYSLDEFQRTLFTGLLSAPVLVAIGAGGMKFRQARKDGRLKLRTDAQDADNDLVEHWKAAAENAQTSGAAALKAAQDEAERRVAAERASKESAIRTVRELLELQEAQNTALRDTIDRLTRAIEQLTTAGGAASELVQQLRDERDQLQQKLDAAMRRVAMLTSQLMAKQRDLLGVDDASTAELVALDADLQRRADTGPTPVQGGSTT